MNVILLRNILLQLLPYTKLKLSFVDFLKRLLLQEVFVYNTEHVKMIRELLYAENIVCNTRTNNFWIYIGFKTGDLYLS
jgi:hypothetical protein